MRRFALGLCLVIGTSAVAEEPRAPSKALAVVNKDLLAGDFERALPGFRPFRPFSSPLSDEGPATLGSARRSQPEPSWAKRKASGCSTSARISSAATTRGPGRLK